MSANRASSGVRNLRAMFENQNAASSPEPRGRSPAGSTTSNDTDRPTSKIRASFVSVEPSGFAARDLGTTKGTSNGENSAAAHRRESFSISQDHGEEVVNELKKTVSQEKEERKKSEAVIETIPEQAVEDRDSSRPPPPIREVSGTMVNLGSIMKGSDFPEPQSTAEKEEAMVEEPAKPAAEPPVAPKQAEEKPIAPSPKDTPGDNPDKTVSAVQDEEAVMKPSDPKNEAAVSGGEALPPPAEVLPSANAENAPPEASEDKGKGKTTEPVEPVVSAPATQPKSKTNGIATSAAPVKSSTKPVGHKPPAISTAKEPANKPLSSKSSTVSKSPAVTKAPKTPTTPSTASPKAPAAKSPAIQAKGQVKEQPKAPAPKASRTSLRSSTASAAPTAATKPKAPVKEPAKAPAKTAAPAPKEPTTQTSPFRKPKPRSPTRPVRLPSHLTAPTASSAAKHDDGAAAPKTIARKPSTVSRPPPKAAAPVRKQPSRASLPAQTAAKRPESRQSARGPDESFLARMMRPTTSSASKTADKLSSPPRRGASVKAPARPKSGHESVAAKGKGKLEESIAKAKEAVTTNGHGETNHHAAESGPAEPAHTGAVEQPNKSTEAAPETPPTEQTGTSGTRDVLQTPNFGEQTIR